MNLTLNEGVNLTKGLVEKVDISAIDNIAVIICPPHTHLQVISKIVKGSGLETGAQNCSHKSEGALTGEVSAEMIKSTGAKYVIVGHSERRIHFNEDNEVLLMKCERVKESGLTPIFCCGESLSEREKNSHFNSIKRQLEEGLLRMDHSSFSGTIIAYEPVWAIGTGLTATPEQAREMHSFIRGTIRERYGAEVAENTTILYGGSCKPTNAAELFSGEDVDGGLIGGAALDAGQFTGIIEALI